jgi:pimeloyl-ACP methyl ester carboxylesterase
MSAAPTWVLLRGLTRERRHWGDFANAFAQEAPAAQVVALDLPGNGALHGLRSPLSVEAMAEHARAQLRERGIAPPVHVLAMSLGAMVATAWAVAAPREIAAAVLINTSLRPFSPWHHRLRPANYAALLRLLVRTNDLARERTVLTLTSRRPVDAALLQAWTSYRRERPVTPANALRQLWAAARYEAPQANPFARVLLLGSLGDGLVDARCTRALATRWACERREHPWAGHDLPLDDAAWVAQQVREWV